MIFGDEARHNRTVRAALSAAFPIPVIQLLQVLTVALGAPGVETGSPYVRVLLRTADTRNIEQ
jgi:hypothetical protein